MKAKNIVFLFLLLAVLITAFVVTIGYPPRARLFPLIVIISCGILVLVELFRSFRTGPASGRPRQEEARAADPQKRQKFLLMTAWMGGFALSLGLLGFAIGMPLFVFTYLKTHGERWLWTIILPAAMFAIVYVGFGMLLETPLYEGLLFLP